jgi:hypothetical protein
MEVRGKKERNLGDRRAGNKDIHIYKHEYNI